MSVATMAEEFQSVTPYNYCLNNPVRLIDPNGNAAIIPPFAYGACKIIGLTLEKYGSIAEVKTAGYAINHPINSLQVRFNYNVAASHFQINIGKVIGEFENLPGTPQNAIRHTLWQAMITSNMDADHAKRIGAVHEDNSSVSALDKADKISDLLNNSIGRSIGEKNKGASNKDLAKAVMEEYRANGLWTVTGNDKNGYTPKRTKISSEQYKAAIMEINKKGENGFNQ